MNCPLAGRCWGCAKLPEPPLGPNRPPVVGAAVWPPKRPPEAWAGWAAPKSPPPAAWGGPRSAAATVLAVGEWLWSSSPSGGPFVETQKDRAKTHIWVLPQLRRKMGHGFASSVGVCFVSVYNPFLGLGHVMRLLLETA